MLSGRDEVLAWTERLCGVSSKRLDEASTRLSTWGIPHVDKALVVRSSIDTAIAAWMLCDSVDELCRRGVPEAKILAKLRRDPDLWPTWAEIRAAALLSRQAADDASFTLEPGRSKGAHPDMCFTSKVTGERNSVEFKAIGLSDQEYAFCRRMAPALHHLVPPHGFATFHTPLDLKRFPLEKFDVAELAQAARTAADQIPKHLNGLCGAVVVGHDGERNYVRRLMRRLMTEVERQLPAGMRGWAAFHWSNGAPIPEVVRAIDWDSIPSCIDGVAFVGDAVVFPLAVIHSFVLMVPRGAEPSSRQRVVSEAIPVAERVLDLFESSSGVRAMRLVAQGSPEPIELELRDGGRRILPFNFLVDSDPPVPLGRVRGQPA